MSYIREDIFPPDYQFQVQSKFKGRAPTTASGTQVDCLDTVVFWVTIGVIEFQHTFVRISDCSYDCILGCDLLEKFDRVKFVFRPELKCVLQKLKKTVDATKRDFVTSFCNRL